MSVTMRFSPEFCKYIAGLDTVQVDGQTIGECLQSMFRQCPDLVQALPVTGFSIQVGEKRAFSWESDRQVNDGDELVLSIFPGCC